MATAHPVQISIGATLAASLGSAVRGAQAQLNQLGSTMAELGNKQSGIKQLETLRAQAKDAALAMRAARQKVSRLEANIANQGGEPSAKQARELERARAAAARAEEAYRRQRAAVDELSASLTKSGVNLRAVGAESAKLGQQMETLRSRTEALTRAQQAQARNLENRSAYRDQMMDAVALGGALYGLVKPAVKFESVMADVKKVVNFDTPQQFAQMSKDVLLLSTRIPMAAEGIGAIVAAAGQAGIAREELLRFAEDAAKMGVAFDLSGEQAGAAMSGLRSIFGLTQDEVVKLGDAINHLSNNMDAKASDLLNIANRAGSTAKLFGLSGAQLNALGATFLALKTPPEVAATGINALLMKLATADKQGGKFQEALFGIGLSAKVMKQMIQRDAQGALTTFLRQVKKAPDLMGTLSDLFGMEYADDIAKLVGSMETYEKSVGLVADQTAYAGSMQKEYEARSATTANNLQLLKNQMSRLGITVGNALLPALNNLVGALMGPIDSLANLAERFPIVTQVVVGTSRCGGGSEGGDHRTGLCLDLREGADPRCAGGVSVGSRGAGPAASAGSSNRGQRGHPVAGLGTHQDGRAWIDRPDQDGGTGLLGHAAGHWCHHDCALDQPDHLDRGRHWRSGRRSGLGDPQILGPDCRIRRRRVPRHPVSRAASDHQLDHGAGATGTHRPGGRVGVRIHRRWREPGGRLDRGFARASDTLHGCVQQPVRLRPVSRDGDRWRVEHGVYGADRAYPGGGHAGGVGD